MDPPYPEAVRVHSDQISPVTAVCSCPRRIDSATGVACRTLRERWPPALMTPLQSEPTHISGQCCGCRVAVASHPAKMLVILSRYGVAVPRIHIRSASCLTRGREALPASPGVQSSAVGKRQRRRGASLGVRSTPCPFAARAGDAARRNTAAARCRKPTP